MRGQEYRKYTIEDYNTALNLNKKGFSLRKISNSLQISSATIWHWTHTKRKPRFVYAKSREKPIKETSKKLSSSLAYIYGVLVGDGSIERNDRTNRIVLNVTDKDFANKFEHELKRWSGIEPTRNERDVNFDHVTKWGNRIVGKSHYYVVRLGSKKAVEFLINKGMFGTYNWKVPEDIKHCNNEKIICSFLKGFFDSDGYVTLSKNKRTRFIGAQNFNTGGLEEIQNLLFKIEIQSSITQSNEQKIRNMHSITISNRKSLEIFSKKINFSIKRKIESLEKLLKSYSRLEVYYGSEEVQDLILKLLRKKPRTINQISKSINRSIRTTHYHLQKLKKTRKVKMIRNWREVSANASNIWLINNHQMKKNWNSGGLIAWSIERGSGLK